MTIRQGFETEASSIRSLGTTGFDETDIIAFLSARTEEMIASYIIFNQVWDVPVSYTALCI